MQGGGGGGGGALVYLGAISAAEAAAVPMANAERARSIFFILASPTKTGLGRIPRSFYTTHRRKAVTGLQHRATFAKLLISFNPLTVAPMATLNPVPSPRTRR